MACAKGPLTIEPVTATSDEGVLSTGGSTGGLLPPPLLPLPPPQAVKVLIIKNEENNLNELISFPFEIRNFFI